GHEQGGFVFISSDLSNYKAKSPNSVEAQLKGDILHDLRDGKSYRTAVLNDGRRWMVENLDYDVAGSICCNFRRGTDGSCAQGRRHYYWRGGEGACPSGWHIPTYEEWAKFLEINGATKDNLGEIKIEGKIREYNEYGLIHIIDYWDYLGNQIVGLNLTGTVCNGKAHGDVQGLYLVKVDGTSYGSSPLLNFYCSGDNGYSYGCKVSLSKASDYKFMSDYATCVRCIQDIKN
ncbi:MAG: FISUMP domain-containing protein, partial [Bacteroidota bacterium]